MVRGATTTFRATPCGDTEWDMAISPTQVNHRCLPGGGNAAIRPFQCSPHWQAAGMPTGTYENGSPHYQGYSSIDARVARAVADSILQIDRLLATGRFTALAFSWNKVTKLGGRLFNTAQPVRDHIVTALESVAARHQTGLIRSEFQGEGREGDFGFMIVRQPDVLFVFNDNEEEFYSHFNDPANPYGKGGDSPRV